ESSAAIRRRTAYRSYSRPPWYQRLLASTSPTSINGCGFEARAPLQIDARSGRARLWGAELGRRDTARPGRHAPRHGRPVHDEQADASTGRLAYSARAKARSP